MYNFWSYGIIFITGHNELGNGSLDSGIYVWRKSCKDYAILPSVPGTIISKHFLKDQSAKADKVSSQRENKNNG